MNILFDHKASAPPKVSIILLDWSCRESFHTLTYLNNQTVSREDYEIIWIEYYSKHATEIEKSLEECKKKGLPPIIDQWIVMDLPGDIYYHKHLMYNVGIVAGRGEIITLCDSDSIVSPTLVENIIKGFNAGSDIVLHMDQVRNNDKKFYPFRYPSIEEILGPACINWADGKTTGLLDTKDTIHTRNYGACMCATRENLIAIGGADEHIDYLGHICGPYELTFRLVNNGLKEVWHEEEFLYHTWHPGSDGKGNYLGPHDGANISTTALSAKRSGRVMPLVENPAIKTIRLDDDDILYEPLLSQAIPDEDLKEWTIDKLGKHQKKSKKWARILRQPLVNLRLAAALIKVTGKQFHMKATKNSWKPNSLAATLRKVPRAFMFLRNINKYNLHVVERCRVCLNEFTTSNVEKFALYGTGDVAEILYKLTLSTPVRVDRVYDRLQNKQFHNLPILPVEKIRGYDGKIVVGTLVGVEDSVKLLERMGTRSEDIVLL